MKPRRKPRYPYNAAHKRDRLEAIRQAAGKVCAKCGKWDHRINYDHLCHDPFCRKPGHRVLLCRVCHPRNDHKQSHARARRTVARECNWPWLDREIELAAYPVETWPAKDRQVEMFDAIIT